MKLKNSSKSGAIFIKKLNIKKVTIKLPIYLDYQSTTPMDPRVIDVMVKTMKEDYGNPHSRTHALGWKAEELVEIARRQVADLIGADPKEIFHVGSD